VLTRGEDLGGVHRAGSPDGEAALLELRSDLLLHRFAAACSLHSGGQSVSGGRRAGDQVAWGSGEGKGARDLGSRARRGGAVAGNGGTKWRETLAGAEGLGSAGRSGRAAACTLLGWLGRIVSAHKLKRQWDSMWDSI